MTGVILRPAKKIRASLLGCGSRCRCLGVQTHRQAGLLPARGGRVNHTNLGRFVKGRRQTAEGGGCFFFLTGLDQIQVFLFQGVQARLHAAIARLLAGAVAHPSFG